MMFSRALLVDNRSNSFEHRERVRLARETTYKSRQLLDSCLESNNFYDVETSMIHAKSAEGKSTIVVHFNKNNTHRTISQISLIRLIAITYSHPYNS
jgi:hypothetical protein